KPVWDVAAVNVWKTQASDDQDEVNVQRHAAPPSGLDEDMSSRWHKLVGREYPYNAVANADNGQMGIDAVAPSGAAGSRPSSVLYTAFYGATGTRAQDVMKGKLDLLTKDLQVMEH
ncbi:MAG: serine protease, partial [Xanthomonadaceae bacterium]|nr:serine protease [Xanthomonadaceae bacterium]